MNIDEYISEHASPLPEVFYWLEKETHLRTNHGRMLSGHLQARLLIAFSRMLRPENILEIGTFTGYSAIALAQGLASGGRLDTVERNDELEDLILQGFRMAGLEEKITLHLGEAQEIVPTLGKVYDMVYIDGNKRQYCHYYNMVFDMVRPEGYILVDNVIWSGKVTDNYPSQDAQTQEILRFNHLIKEDPRVENFILPLRDGLSIIRKL